MKTACARSRTTCHRRKNPHKKGRELLVARMQSVNIRLVPTKRFTNLIGKLCTIIHIQLWLLENTEDNSFCFPIMYVRSWSKIDKYSLSIGNTIMTGPPS